MTQIFLSLLSSSVLFVRALKKDKKQDAAKDTKKEKRVIDDKDRHKPFGKTAWVPVDDVYIVRYFPRTTYGVEDAIGMLKNFQRLDFTPHNQPVYIDLKLNMKLEKKVIALTTTQQLCLILSIIFFKVRNMLFFFFFGLFLALLIAQLKIRWEK